MAETYLLNLPGVRKKILAGGAGPLPHFPPGAKVINYSLTLTTRITPDMNTLNLINSDSLSERTVVMK